jgi:protein-disulfide isomerase
MNHLPPVGPADHIQGPNDAPVTLVEYGDFQCPYCGTMYGVIKTVQRAMESELRFVFRHFPLTDIHAHALHAAEFAEAATRFDKFWEAHDILYENQTALGDRELEQYWKQLDCPSNALIAAFEGSDDARIQSDLNGGIRSGVNGTPSLFINGHFYAGAHDAESLFAALRIATARA